MRSNKKIGIATLVAVVLTFMLAGCTYPGTDDSALDDLVACKDVPDQLTAAEDDLDDAQADAKDPEIAGTPAVLEAEARIETLEAKIAMLKDRANDPECQAVAGPTATPTPKPTPKPSATATDCGGAQYIQVALDRSNYMVDPRYQPAVEDVINNNALTPEQKIKGIKNVEIKLAASNAQTLAALAHSVGLHDNASNYKGLVEGGVIVDGACLSEEGKDLLAQYKGAIFAKGVTLEVGEASPEDTNSGINGEVFVVASEPGIVGDRRAIILTLSDGTKVIKMIRCMNFVYPGGMVPPNTPKGQTDNPPPTTETTEEKHPTEGSYPNGNADTGGGTNADSGTGTALPVTRPGTETRVDPPAPPVVVAEPQPVTSSNPVPAPVPTVDPDPPTAVPAPSAPPSPAPETGCDASVPGVTC